MTQSEFSRKSLHSLDHQNEEQSSASLKSESYDSQEENDVVPSPKEKKLAEKRTTKVLLSISDTEEADDTHIEREFTETDV